MTAFFHFVSLECIEQNELGADEIVVLYQGEQVFPPVEGDDHSMRRGALLYNSKAPISAEELAALRGRERAIDAAQYADVEDFLKLEIPTSGIGVRVVEKDGPWTRDDIIVQVLASPVATDGVRVDPLTGGGSHYELRWMVTEASPAE